MKTVSSRPSSQQKVPKAEVVYSYEVAGKTLRNSTICIGGQLMTSWRAKAEDVIERYPKGADVLVHFNPDDPADSVLEVREETSLFILIVGGFFGVVGVLMLTGVIN